MRATWRLGKWRGIPIVLHWTVFLGVPWFYYQTRSVAATVVSFAAFFFLLIAHELGHALVARWRNVPVGSIQLFLIHGSCTHDEPYDEEDDVLIAWGGVAAQLVVLVVAAAASLLVTTALPVAHAVTAPLFRVLIQTNLLIMVINLIPVAPLDGAKAWRALPMLKEWAGQSSWTTSLRRLFAARERARAKKLEAKSERIAADIIDRLKKGKSDAQQ
jgi:stage IV sporulation protein FB